jgi:hypothetical protein
MLRTDGLNGEVKCVEDNASCVLDGENARGGMHVEGTGGDPLILRALTFDKFLAGSGGGVWINGDTIVDFELCVFSNNRATDTEYYDDDCGIYDNWCYHDEFGGGAIYVSDTGYDPYVSSGISVNVFSTSFNGNTADSGMGADIYNNGGTVTIHYTCPSPYSSNTPIQGKTRMRLCSL